MYIITHTLGSGAEDAPKFQYADRSKFSARRLEINLDWHWAWQGVVKDADGPCVAVSWHAPCECGFYNRDRYHGALGGGRCRNFEQRQRE